MPAGFSRQPNHQDAHEASVRSGDIDYTEPYPTALIVGEPVP
jgi:hypothetical protein